MTSAPMVVSVAARMGRKAFLSPFRRIWSVITMVLSITRLSEMVIPANEYSWISKPSRK